MQWECKNNYRCNNAGEEREGVMNGKKIGGQNRYTRREGGS